MSDDDQRPVAPGADGPDPGPKGEARPTHSGGRPGLLVLALVLVAMQALGLVVLALAGLGGLVGIPAAGQITIVTLAVVLLGLAALIGAAGWALRSEEHTSELQSRGHLVCRLLLGKKKRSRFPSVLCPSLAAMVER